MMDSLAVQVDRFSGVRVLVIGDAMVDHYTIGSIDRISPEAPVPILRVEREFDRVGGAANVAANVASLGGQALLACLVGRDHSEGRDPVGEHLIRRCEEMGIEVTPFRFLPCTIRKARMLAGQQQVLRVDWEHPFGRTEAEQQVAMARGTPWAPLPLPTSAADGRREALKPLIERAQVILISDYAKGMIDGELMEQVGASRKPVIVDPRPQHASLYKGIALITPNRREALEILGLDAHLAMPPEELGRRLRDRLDCDVLVTLGDQGMCIVTRAGDEGHISAYMREVFDVTGAGDTVAACMALGLGAGLSLHEAASVANAAASVVVGHVGTAVVTPVELRQVLSDRGPGKRSRRSHKAGSSRRGKHR